MAETAARLDELADSLPPPAEVADVGGDVGVAAEPVEHPAETPEPPSTSSDDGVDPLDRLLREYDDRNGGNSGTDATADDDIIAALDAANQQAAREQEFQTFQAQTAQQQADASIAAAQRDRQLAEAQQTIGSLQSVIAAELQRQHQARSLEDFKRLTADEQAKLDGLDVPDNHVETFLLAEAARDPELQRAWEGKYYEPPGPIDRARIAANIQQWAEGQARMALQLSNPLARRMAQQNIESSMKQMWAQAFPDPATYRANAAEYVRKAIDRMHKEARRPRIDLQATADHEAVAAAVRGASTNKIPAEPAPVWGELTDSQLNAFTKQLGFRAI
jgi:hypothetical protein